MAEEPKKEDEVKVDPWLKYLLARWWGHLADRRILVRLRGPGLLVCGLCGGPGRRPRPYHRGLALQLGGKGRLCAAVRHPRRDFFHRGSVQALPGLGAAQTA